MSRNIEVVDLFCGVGALSYGLKAAGLNVLSGYDLDADCRFAYQENLKAKFFARDVETLTPEEVKANYSCDSVRVLAGCAPCQPFSTYTQRKKKDRRWRLLQEFARIAVGVDPDFITMENVPALVRHRSGEVFSLFCSSLADAGYQISWQIVKCEEFGVPQRRRRLVLVASKGRAVELPAGKFDYPVTVKDAIGHLPRIAAGSTCRTDRLHSSAGLSEVNLGRIRASSPGGTWADWPMSMKASCHNKQSGSTYSAVYGRMKWEAPSPTITTQCYGYGSGRFGHPEQDRAISLREAACLQSFPDTYKFVPSGEKISFKRIGRWIGNAVPVKLARAIGQAIGNHVGASYGERAEV
jgi:DNA (cytosine-5)-methyltransferase 1